MMNWQTLSALPALAEQEAHCHFCCLENIQPSDCLSDDEKQRAARFKFDKHRQAFICARSYLRHVLARYLNCQPAEIEFSYHEQGKPYLANQALQFNLSHTSKAVALIVARHSEVGIDIEYAKRAIDIDLLSEKIFTQQEKESLAQSEDKQRHFFQLWTRKEALVKAMGTGLFVDLVSLDVLADSAGEQQGRHWQLAQLTSLANHQVAIAYEAKKITVCRGLVGIQ